MAFASNGSEASLFFQLLCEKIIHAERFLQVVEIDNLLAIEVATDNFRGEIDFGGERRIRADCSGDAAHRGRIVDDFLQPPSRLGIAACDLLQDRLTFARIDLMVGVGGSDHGQIIRPLRISASAGSLELRDIVFAYGPHSPEISLTHLSIAAGEKVAILGRVGAGKSTVLKMIAGLIKPRSGQVLVDGLDIFSITPDRRAELIGYLGQNPGLIQGTVRENLLMGHAHIDDDALIAACKQTGLMEILMMRHQGFESPIHENGSGFSGGQRQLIALTRLLLVKPRVWLLDEPTAALDGLGEGRVLATLRQAIAEEDTLVLVTPKVPPLDLVDRVIVIDGSSILFDGSKERVLAS